MVGDITFLPMEAIGDDGTYDRESVRPAAEVVDSGYTYFEQGDVVRARVTPCFENGKGALLSSLTSGRGLGTTELFVFQPSSAIDARYLFYVTASHEFTGLGTATIYGAHGVRRVDDKFARDYRVWLPPLTTQRAIADYLHRETARIDALIVAKQKMVELLDDRRQAVIDGAMLGRPKVRVKHLVSRITSGPRGWAEYAANDGVLFLRIANVSASDTELDMTNTMYVQPPESAERRRTSVCTGDVLVSITAEIGSVGVARATHAGGAVSQHVALLTPRLCSGDWLAFALCSSDAKAQQRRHDTAAPRLS